MRSTLQDKEETKDAIAGLEYELAAERAASTELDAKVARLESELAAECDGKKQLQQQVTELQAKREESVETLLALVRHIGRAPRRRRTRSQGSKPSWR